MDGIQVTDQAVVAAAGLGRLMPLFVWVGPSGHVRATGPTLAKLCEGPLVGARFLELFEIVKPRPVDSMSDLRAMEGLRLRLGLRGGPRTALRGHLVPLEDGQGVLVNLSFGIGATQAVREHRLTSADFAPTDLTVELLYLTEAKAAVMDELAALNRRLDEARAAAEAQALTDALTGLANRRGLALALGQAVAAAKRGRHDFALLHVDLDLFKTVNDTLGHAAGDFVLIRVADVLRTATRKYDVVARAGGDEFVLILFDGIAVDEIETTATRIIRDLEQPMEFDGKPCAISGSVGATVSTFYDCPDADRMLSDADTALYVSKHRGRGRCTVYAPGLKLPEYRRAGDGR